MLHIKYQSCMSYSFREEDFQRFCKYFPFGCQTLPWQPKLWMELNSLNNFCSALPKEHPYQVSSNLAQWFRRRRCLKKLLTDARHRAITIAHSKHFVLRWAKKEKLLVTSNFSFSHNVFYPIWHLFSILNALWNVVCNLFQFGPV